MYREAELDAYLEDAASEKPAPGGGSVSALAGALASAMGEMSANFTVGKEKFADVEDDVRRMLAELEECRGALLELMEEDVRAYSAVSEAYSMPRGSQEEKGARREAIDRALRGAMHAPLRVMRRCGRVAGVADSLVEMANPNLITDVGVCAVLAEAACAAARFNVEINLKFLGDADLRRETEEEMDRLTERVEKVRDAVSEKVGRHLSD